MNCRNISTQKLFVYQEMRSKLTLENVDNVESTRIKVDGCEINDNSIRCDFMHLAKGIEFYIELKGQNLEHALEQIKATIIRLSTNIKKGNKISYVICTRSPMSSSEIQNHKLEFRKKFNSKLEIKSSPFKDIY